MLWWGTGGRALSRSRWTQLRTSALEQLSVEYYGQVSDCDQYDVRLSVKQIDMLTAGGGFGVPVVLLVLKKRAKHSNFGKCVKCYNAQCKWALERKANSGRSIAWTFAEAEAKKREIFKHVMDVKEERVVAMEFHQAAMGSILLSFEYDDKCGSSFCHLPSPAGGRYFSLLLTTYYLLLTTYYLLLTTYYSLLTICYLLLTTSLCTLHPTFYSPILSCA